MRDITTKREDQGKQYHEREINTNAKERETGGQEPGMERDGVRNPALRKKKEAVVGGDEAECEDPR